MKPYHIDGEEKFIAGAYTRERDFWVTKLSGDLEKSSFPYNYEHAAENKRQMFSVTCGIPETLESILIKASNNSDFRLHMILVAGMVLLLNKYTGNKDIITGIPIYKQEVEGDFVNTALILRNQLEDHITFKDLLIQVRQSIVEANKHVNYPIDIIPHELGMAYSEEDDFPLFDIITLLENVHNKNHIRHIRSNMIFSFTRTGENIEGLVEYNAALYTGKAVERIGGHYTYLLHEALVNPNTPLVDISVLSAEDKEKMLLTWNDTDTTYPKEMTIQQLFEAQVEATPHHIAVVSDSQQVTYKKLNEQANRMAALLIGKGIDVNVKENIIVGIMGQRSIWIVAGILGILKAGAAYLPINAKDPGERIKFILEDSKAAALITQEHLVKSNPSLLGIESLENIILIEDMVGEDIDHAVYKNRECLSKPGDNIYLIYTSGTTGKPKGVLVKQQGVVNYVWWAAKQYVKNEKINFPLFTSIAFDLTVTSLFTPLITGNAIVVYGDGGEGNEALIERVMKDNRVGVVKLTPSHLKLIKDRDTDERILSVKRFILGGEQLGIRLAKEVYRSYRGKVEIYNEYGPTEAAVGCMIYRFNPHEDSAVGKSVPIGKPIANTRIYLLDEKLEPVPIGAAGELYISGEGLAAGYLYQPGLTAEKFIPNPFLPGDTMYRTGDLAKCFEDGNVEFLGRIDDQVKIRGYRIELGEIENRLLGHDDIKEAVVIVKEDEDGDSYLCAYIVSKRDVPVFELREYLDAQLPDYMIPSYFVTIDKLPLNRNGKIDTKALPEPKVNAGMEYIAPRDETEKRLVKIWSEILSIDEPELSIDVNFFEVGGHSLKATVLAAKVHKIFNVQVSLESIFRFPTLRELAEYLKDSETDVFVGIEPTEKKEFYPLSSAQKRLYFLQQMDKESTIYNMPAVMMLVGDVDIDKIKDTFIKLIKRHESLRTSIELVGDEPVQRIHEKFEFRLGYNEMGEQSHEEIVEKFVTLFDLGSPPLLRVELIREEEKKHLLLLDMHHIISDGISQGLMTKDFMLLYAGEELFELKIHYKDYSEWENSEAHKEKLKKQESYWLKQLEGELPVLDLPTDYSRPPVWNFEGRCERFTIEKETTKALEKIASDENVTLFMLLLAILNVWLSRISGQEDIFIGLNSGGRNHTDLQPIVGAFINTLVLRNYPQDEKSFKEFLQEVKFTTLEVLENQDYHFEDLVSKLGVNRNPSRNPLFDVGFALWNNENMAGEITEIEIPGLKLTPYEYEIRNTKHDLLIYCIQKEDELTFFIEYCTKLFKIKTIERFINYFKKIVCSVVSDPGQKIKNVEITSKEEKEEIRQRLQKAKESIHAEFEI